MSTKCMPMLPFVSIIPVVAGQSSWVITQKSSSVTSKRYMRKSAYYYVNKTKIKQNWYNINM